MSKKIASKNKDIFSEQVQHMNRNYLHGDFWQARKIAWQIIAKETDEVEVRAARSILKKTWLDYQALLAGVGCLAFSLAAAFLAS